MSDHLHADPGNDGLRRDEKVEQRVLWKGVLALVATIALAFARQRWWVP